LSILSQSSGDTVSRTEIIEALWDDSKFISDNTLTVNINRLRKKLENIGLNEAIQTKTGIGYIRKEEWEMYWKENVQIILLFFLFNSYILLIGLLDNGIPNISVIYIFFFNLIIFTVYIIWDYVRKRKFCKEFENLETLNDVVGMTNGNTPGQRDIYEKLD